MARPERTNLRTLEQRDWTNRSPRSGRTENQPDLREALEVVRLRRWSIALVTVLTVSVAVLFSMRQVPMYASQAKVLVNAVDPSTEPGQTPSSPNMATEADLVSSAAVAEFVAKDLHYSGDPNDLLSGLSVDTPTNTEILEISDTNASPQEAQRRAQAFADGYLAYRERLANNKIDQAAKQINNQLDELHTQLINTQAALDKTPPGSTLANSLESTIGELNNLIVQTELQLHDLPQAFLVGSVIQSASRNSAPVSPNHVLNAAFGLIAGLALGIGIAFLRDRLSGRLRSPAEIEEQSGMQVLASIPRVPGWRRRREAFLVTRRNWQSPASEAYRILRTALSSGPGMDDVKSILVTSAQSGEGKSTTVANLATVFASVGKRVTVVSADLRKPRLGEFFGINERFGLSEVLQGRVSLHDAVVEVPWTRTSLARGVPGFSAAYLLPSGGIPEHPAELLASSAMVSVIEQLESDCDVLLIDSTPLLSVTDALVVAPLVDGVLLVIGPGSATRASVQSLGQQLDRAGANVLGVALNCFENASRQTYSY